MATKRTEKQYSALEIANYIVYLLKDVCEDLTNMKLNKLIYFAQGQYLKETGKPLFNDNIEAWDYGPVVESVYQKYKRFNNKPISIYNKRMANTISMEVSDFLIGISRKYGKFTASSLVSKTHMINSPWDQVYQGKERHVLIPVNIIKEYFINHEEGIDDVVLPFSAADYIETRDKDGILILPKEWNNETV